MKKFNKFNHIVGEVVGSVLQFFGCLYFICASLIGASVLMLGTYYVFADWYHDNGFTFKTIFLIVTATIGIMFLIVDYGLALRRDLREWVGTKQNKTTERLNGG